MLFFSAILSSEDVAAKVRSIDIIKEAALILREEIRSTSFGLETNIALRMIKQTVGLKE